MSHRPDPRKAPTSTSDPKPMDANEYNRKMAEELEKLNEYKKAIQSEFEQQVVDQQKVEYLAKRTLHDAAPHAATQIVNIALGKVSDTNPATMLAAARFVIERALPVSADNPEINAMDALMERLRTPVDAVAETDPED